MSSGRTHRLVNLTAATLVPGGAAAGYLLGAWPGLATISAGYALSTFGVNPDKDLVRRTYEERGRLWGNFLFWWGLPYAILFRHRGLSHVHLIGTFTRVVFMGLWLVPLLLIAAGVPARFVGPYASLSFLGLVVGDSMHIAADGGQRQREHRE